MKFHQLLDKTKEIEGGISRRKEKIVVNNFFCDDVTTLNTPLPLVTACHHPWVSPSPPPLGQ